MSSIAGLSKSEARGLTLPALAAHERLESLQALRGLAAMLVLVMHATQLAGAFSGRGLAGGIVSVGFFGVDIFFVLSGVVISILLRRNTTRPEAPIGFLLRRAAKLLPTFWVTLVLLLLLPPSPDASTSLTALLANPLSLVLLASQNAHPVGWTLLYEVQFYIVAALALCFGRQASTAMLWWIPLQLVVVGLAMAGVLRVGVLGHPLMLELIAGLIVGTLAPRFRLPLPGPLAVGALLAMVAAAAMLPIAEITEQGLLRVLVLGLPATVLVYAALSLEAEGWRPPRFSLWLGEISYSLYMWHIVVLMVLAVLLIGTMQNLPVVMAYWAAGIGLSIVVSAGAYRYIEEPVVRAANAWTRRRAA